MFAISYLDNNNKISLKGGFKSDKAAYRWIDDNELYITPLKLLFWSDEIDCYDTLRTL